MSIAISSALATASLAAANSSSTTEAAQPAQPAANDAAYTVSLTEAQQVYNLYNQGQAVSQIASNLSLTVSAVNSYLGIAAGS